MNEADQLERLVGIIESAGAVGGILVGLAIAWVVTKEVRKWVKPEERRRTDDALLKVLEALRADLVAHSRETEQRQRAFAEQIKTLSDQITLNVNTIERVGRLLDKVSDRQQAIELLVTRIEGGVRAAGG